MALETYTYIPPERRNTGKPPYPYLARYVNSEGDHVVVMFTGEKYGVIVDVNPSASCAWWEIGAIMNNWREDDFKPLTPEEQVVLRNV